jgi:hypothetical protein
LLDGTAHDEDLPHLAIRYYRFVFADPDTRTVAFTNPFVGISGLNVHAFIQIGGKWSEEDWTPLKHVGFCRDVTAERVEQLVIVLSNANLGDASLPGKPTLVRTNIGCYRWTGTAGGTLTQTDWLPGSSMVMTATTVTFERDTSKPMPDSLRMYNEFKPVSGSLTFVEDITTAVDSCRTTGPLQTYPIPDRSALGQNGNLAIDLYGDPATDANARNYSGVASTIELAPVTKTCPKMTPVPTQTATAPAWLTTTDYPTPVTHKIDAAGKMKDTATAVGTNGPTAKTVFTWELAPVAQ